MREQEVVGFRVLFHGGDLLSAVGEDHRLRPRLLRPRDRPLHQLHLEHVVGRVHGLDAFGVELRILPTMAMHGRAPNVRRLARIGHDPELSKPRKENGLPISRAL